MRRRNIAFITLFTLAVPGVHAQPQERSTQQILAEALEMLGEQAHEHATTSRVALKSAQKVAIAHAKNQLKAQKPVGPLAEAGKLSRVQTWVANHAGLIADVLKILSGHVIDQAVPATGYTRRDRMAEAYLPVLAKTADKHGAMGDAHLKALLSTCVERHFFADKNTTLDTAGDALATTLSFFEEDILTNPREWRSYFALNQGMQALSYCALSNTLSTLLSERLGKRFDKATTKTMLALATRLCMEPLGELVDRGVSLVRDHTSTSTSEQ